MGTTADPGEGVFGDIQVALGVVARRAKDFSLHERIGARVGYSLEGPYYGTLSRLGLAGECTVTELAELLGLELSTVSRRVKALEDRGLVERRIVPTDRRTSRLRLTGEGRQLFEALSASWRGMLAEAMADWDPASVERFGELFVRFAADLERYAERGPAAGTARATAPGAGRS